MPSYSIQPNPLTLWEESSCTQNQRTASFFPSFMPSWSGYFSLRRANCMLHWEEKKTICTCCSHAYSLQTQGSRCLGGKKRKDLRWRVTSKAKGHWFLRDGRGFSFLIGHHKGRRWAIAEVAGVRITCTEEEKKKKKVGDEEEEKTRKQRCIAAAHKPRE